MADLAAVRRNLMYPNRAWNRQGPPVPAWFRRRMKAIDPTLELQFFPPVDPIRSGRDGVDRRSSPNGQWAICRKMPRSKMLLKQWVWGFKPDKKNLAGFHPDILKVLRSARNLWRRSKYDQFTTTLDRSIARIHGERDEKARKRLAQGIADSCRFHEFTKEATGSVVFMRGGGPKCEPRSSKTSSSG